jgi:nicotinamidase/pyrazinamidase
MWPPHCIQTTEGAKFVSSLVTKTSDFVILKGVYPQVDSYSAFGDANGHTTEKTTCEAILRKNTITHVVICGLALDYCVSYSARDAAAAGFKTYVVLDACRGIAQESIDKEIALMTTAGVTIVESMDGLPAELLH